jgi:uncharacterized OB-fold protein
MSADGAPQPAAKRPPRTLRDDNDRRFWHYCAAGELRMQRCAACAKFAWPPASHGDTCDACGGQDFAWERLSGRGKLRSFCTFERQYYPECPPPWTVILVELEEGPLFISDPQGFEPAAFVAGEAREGMPLVLAFLACADEHGDFRLPVFAPA